MQATHHVLRPSDHCMHKKIHFRWLIHRGTQTKTNKHHRWSLTYGHE